MLLSIGDQVKAGTYPFHSWFNRAVNFEHDGRLLAVVDESVGPGPLNIVLRGLTRMLHAPREMPTGRSAGFQTGLALAQGTGMDDQCGRHKPVWEPALRPRKHDILVPRNSQAQGHTEPPPSILKGLHHSARGWIASPFPGDPTLGKRPGKASNPNGVASRPAFDSPLQITPRTIAFAGHRYHFTSRHRYDSTLALPLIDLPRFQHNLSTLGETLKQIAPPKSLAFLLDAGRRKPFRAGFERAFAEQITRGVGLVLRGPLLQGVRHLKGCGLGLTPAGDDFIAGLLTAQHLLQTLRGQKAQPTADAIFRAARGDNIFSNTFLDLARRGLLFGHLKDLLLALVAGSGASVRKAAEDLFAVGETSGADLATGLFLTLHEPPPSGCMSARCGGGGEGWSHNRSGELNGYS